MNDTISIGIIVPSPAFGVGLKTVIEQHEPQFRVDCLARDLASFIEKAPDKIDMILLDAAIFGFSLNANPRDGFAKFPNAPLVGITVEQLMPDTVTKFDGLCHVYDEGECIARQMKTAYETFHAATEEAACDCVTEREKEIIVAIAMGQSNKEIANDLCLSPHTIATYRKRISSKLGIRGAAGFATYAMINNLLEQIL